MTAQRIALGEGLHIRLATAVAFVATKLEAFISRGRGDMLASHDLEDVLNIVDGREELVRELADALPDVRHAIAATLAHLLARPSFLDVLPGLIAEPERADVVAGRLRAMAQR
jgi:predicted nucleotidyltransferase